MSILNQPYWSCVGLIRLELCPASKWAVKSCLEFVTIANTPAADGSVSWYASSFLNINYLISRFFAKPESFNNWLHKMQIE